MVEIRICWEMETFATEKSSLICEFPCITSSWWQEIHFFERKHIFVAEKPETQFVTWTDFWRSATCCFWGPWLFFFSILKETNDLRVGVCMTLRNVSWPIQRACFHKCSKVVFFVTLALCLRVMVVAWYWSHVRVVAVKLRLSKTKPGFVCTCSVLGTGFGNPPNFWLCSAVQCSAAESSLVASMYYSCEWYKRSLVEAGGISHQSENRTMVLSFWWIRVHCVWACSILGTRPGSLSDPNFRPCCAAERPWFVLLCFMPLPFPMAWSLKTGLVQPVKETGWHKTAEISSFGVLIPPTRDLPPPYCTADVHHNIQSLRTSCLVWDPVWCRKPTGPYVTYHVE